MIPAAAYYRMSSDAQGESIPGQRAALNAETPRNGYAIVREYVDEGRQGWRDDRKDFQRLIADASTGAFQAVVCWDQDRFSRFPVLEANHYWYLLDKAGVHIWTINQGRLDFASLAGWLTASIAQHGKAEYCRDLARNTSRGLRKRRLAGMWNGPAPLGYVLDKEVGRLVLGDDGEIATVRQIYEMRAQGCGYWLIAKHLNDSGIAPRRAASWSLQAVRHILQADAYLGSVMIGKWADGRYEHLTPQPVEVPDSHPAIIDRPLWDAVRQVERQNSDRCAHWKGDAMSGGALGGLLFCKHCGSRMHFVRYRERAHLNHYVCGTNHRGSGCRYGRVGSDSMLALVARKIRARLPVENLMAAIERQLAKERDKAPDSAAVERQVAKLDSQIARATDRLVSVDASLVDDVQRKLLDLKAKRASLVRPGAPPPASLLAKDVAARFARIEAAIDSGRPGEIRRELSQVIERIDLQFEHWKTTSTGRNRFRPCAGTLRLFIDGSRASGGSLVLWKQQVRLTSRELNAA